MEIAAVVRPQFTNQDMITSPASIPQGSFSPVEMAPDPHARLPRDQMLRRLQLAHHPCGKIRPGRLFGMATDFVPGLGSPICVTPFRTNRVVLQHSPFC